MPDRNGYIGRAPSDSSVTVARQTFTPTGVTTDFTFAAGYVPGYFDIYINGAKQIEASDYTSTDGSTFSILSGGAQNGDVIEAVAYKAFNAAAVTNAADLTVSGNLTVNGSATFAGAGTSVAFATTSYNLAGTPNIAVNNVTGTAATFTGNVNIGGVLTYEDVTNIDSVGIVTAQGGLDVTGGNVTIGTGSTVGFGSTAFFPDGAKAVFGDGEDLQIYHNGTHSYIADAGTGKLKLLGTAVEFENAAGDEYILRGVENDAVELYFNNSKKLETTTDGVVITGIVTATSFEGSGANLTNLPASGDSNDITACLFI